MPPITTPLIVLVICIVVIAVAWWFLKKLLFLLLVVLVFGTGYYFLKCDTASFQKILDITGIPFVDTAAHVDSAQKLIDDLNKFFAQEKLIKEIGRAGTNPYLYIMIMTDGEVDFSSRVIKQIEVFALDNISARVYLDFYDVTDPENQGSYTKSYNRIRVK